MEIRQLRYFVQAYNDKSISKAADNLYISQQALSKSIATLEEEIGSRLFYRTPKGLVPTETGLFLFEHSLKAIQVMDNLMTDIASNKRSRQGAIKLGLAVGFTYLLSLDELNSFSLSYPDIRIEATEYGYDQCEHLVEKGEIDIAIVPGPTDNPMLKSDLLTESERVLVLKKDHPLANKVSVAIQDLNGYPFALCINNRCFSRFVQLCKANSFDPIVIHRLSETLVMYDLCQTNSFLGIGIKDICNKHLSHYPLLHSLPIQGNQLSFPIIIVTKKNEAINPIIKVFVKYVKELIPSTDMEPKNY